MKRKSGTTSGDTSGSFDPVQSVDRCFDILEAMSRQPQTRVRELVQMTGIPAPTVVRLLETLVRRGYVQRMQGRSGYCLTTAIITLAAGVRGGASALEPVFRAADTLTNAFRWPASVCTFDTDAMVVRYSTLGFSPLGHKHSTVNRRLDMVSRAHGRAWLAFCEPEQRQDILERLVGRDVIAPVDLVEISRILHAIQEAGVARRDRTIEPDTSTLAVPVIAEGRLVATLGMTHFARAVTDPAPLVRHMRSLADQAGQEMSDPEHTKEPTE